MSNNVDERAIKIAAKLRKIRDLKGLTRGKFCEPLKENSEYCGMIERGEQAISLGKLLQVCEVYHISIEEVICLKYQEGSADEIHSSIVGLLEQCDLRQLEVIRKFIQAIAMVL